MTVFKTAVISAPEEVETRLADFGIIREQIAEIGKVARSYADDASPSMPLNAAGMLAYIYGVGELRQQLVGAEYIRDRTCGIEAVIRKDGSVRIGFQNVDVCCTDMPPIPRSEKGSGAEALSSPTLFQHAGVEPGPLTPVRDGVRTYYVMVGQNGSIELSCPVIEKGQYVAWPERIYISAPDADWEVALDRDNGPVEDFEINVSFKDV